MASRLERYGQKLRFIVEVAASIPAFSDDLARDAAFHRIQTAVDAAMDVAAMLARDLGREVGDDRQNIESLVELGVLPRELGERLKDLNGLRNVIVHQYNGIDDARVEAKVPLARATLEEFCTLAEEHARAILGGDAKGA